MGLWEKLLSPFAASPEKKKVKEKMGDLLNLEPKTTRDGKPVKKNPKK